MPNTYTQIYIQVVFAVADRQHLIASLFKERVHKFISGTVRNEGQKLIAINSMPDHLHLLVGLRPDIALSDLVREVKASSSRFINEQGWLRGRFNWQKGFGAFSYSHSQIGVVARYIENQEAHHKRRTFRDEYLQLLEKFAVEYDSRYVFKWLDE